jgi:hypothetical protein
MIEIIPVELVPHSPLWIDTARSQAARLADMLGSELVTL